MDNNDKQIAKLNELTEEMTLKVREIALRRAFARHHDNRALLVMDYKWAIFSLIDQYVDAKVIGVAEVHAMRIRLSKANSAYNTNAWDAHMIFGSISFSRAAIHILSEHGLDASIDRKVEISDNVNAILTINVQDGMYLRRIKCEIVYEDEYRVLEGRGVTVNGHDVVSLLCTSESFKVD